MSLAEPFLVGVVADTHIPDRAPCLAPGLVAGLSAAGVKHILHAGDVCARRVLDELGEVAPVSAARGNRDVFFSPPLPMVAEVRLAGITIGLIHGHGGVKQYWLDKLGYVFRGYRFERYLSVARKACPQANVWVYGHSHRAENRRVDGRLIFNPGPGVGFRYGSLDIPPSYGLLRIFPDQRVEGEVFPLEGVRLASGTWVRV